MLESLSLSLLRVSVNVLSCRYIKGSDCWNPGKNSGADEQACVTRGFTVDKHELPVPIQYLGVFLKADIYYVTPIPLNPGLHIK